ncbi:MAG: hypothetical protein ACLFV6_17735 [Spirulinaceae cyanobacterium]
MNEDREKNRDFANREFREALEHLKSLSESSDPETPETPTRDRPVNADDPLWEDALADIERYLEEKDEKDD